VRQDVPRQPVADLTPGALQIVVGLRLPASDVTIDALVAYAASNVDFIDAYNSCWMTERGLRTVVTFVEEHYSRWEGMDLRRP